jgi:hypothetical protein
MPLSFNMPSMRGPVVWLLLVIGVGMAFLVVALPATSSRFFGECTACLGALFLLLHRKLGRQVFHSTRQMPSFVVEFWDRIGNEGSQLLHLGIGIILALSGIFLLIR